MEIKSSYLMWIGSEHYKTIEEWCEEASRLGVSKRLPGVAMGEALMRPGTIVFVAHDEGVFHECEGCSGAIECPECRKLLQEGLKESDAAERLASEAGKLDEGKERRSLERRSTNARARAEVLESEAASCETCLGTRLVVAGTGGKVTFEDGETWDYRQYNYWLHQPTKWVPGDKGGVSVMERCEACGGTGRLPDAQVFGMFVPERIEVIEGGDAAKSEAARIAGFIEVPKAALKAEPQRGCGLRKPGGVYAVASAKGGKKARAAAKALGMDLDQCHVHGNFVRFVVPYRINCKRFRGLGAFHPSALLQDAAEMATDALA